MSGLCSIHKEYNKDCKICNAKEMTNSEIKSLSFCISSDKKELAFYKAYSENECDYGYPKKCKEIAVLTSPLYFNKFPGVQHSCRKHINPMFGGFVLAGYNNVIKKSTVLND